MRFNRFSVTLCLLVVTMLISGFVTASTDSGGYGFDVSIVPEQKNPGVFQATFTVTSLDSQKIVIAPTIRFRAGETAQTSTTKSESGVDFRFSVSVNPETSIAEYTAEASKGTNTVSRTTAKISLSK